MNTTQEWILTDTELEELYVTSGIKELDELEHYYYEVSTEWKEAIA